MENDLTPEEERILTQMESMGKWDALTYEMALLVPCAVIMALSACYSSVLGIMVGLLVYGYFRTWAILRQCGSIPTVQSAIRKLKARCQPAYPAERGPAAR